jgi:hypothetical protein
MPTQILFGLFFEVFDIRHRRSGVDLPQVGVALSICIRSNKRLPRQRGIVNRPLKRNGVVAQRNPRIQAGLAVRDGNADALHRRDSWTHVVPEITEDTNDVAIKIGGHKLAHESRRDG